MNAPSIRPPTAILTTAFALALVTFFPVTSDSQCCGGGGFSAGGSKGLPNLGQIVPGERLRLTIHPGTKPQIVEVKNAQTGAVVKTIQVPSGMGGPVGVTVPIPQGQSLTATLKPDPNNTGGGGGSSATVTGNVESSAGTGSESTEEECPEKCERSWYSGGPPENQENNPQEYPSESCDPEDEPGNGEPANSSKNDSGGGAGGEPSNYYESTFEGLQQMQGGINVPMSLGPGSPPLTFTAPNANSAINASPSALRSMVSSPLIRSTDQPVEDQGWDVYRGFIVRDPNSTNIRALRLSSSAVVNLRELPNGLMVEFIDTRAFTGANYPIVQLTPSGYFAVTHWAETANGFWEEVSRPSYAYWIFSKEIVEGTEWLKVQTNKSAKGRVSSSAARTWRFRQFEQAGATVTRMLDVRTGITKDFICHDDIGNQVYARGERTITADGIVKGWKAVAFGDNANVPQPQIMEGEEGLMKVHLGGSGNTRWLWGTDGMFEKTTVEPSIDAPNRTIKILRPWGGTTSPVVANESNSYATIAKITPLTRGFARTDVVKINGYETKWTVRTKWSADGGLDGGRAIHETVQRFPNGFNSVPMVDYTLRNGRRPGDRRSGAPLYEQRSDGTVITYEHTEIPGTPTGDADGAVSSVRTATALNGMVRKQVTVRDWLGRTKEQSDFVVLAGNDFQVSGMRHAYDSPDGGRSLSERLNVGTNTWEAEYQTEYTGGILTKVTETDQAGVVTTSDLDPEGRPLTITRAGYTENGIAYVPARTIRRTYDTTGNLMSEITVQLPQGAGQETSLRKRTWSYYSDGRLKSETFNDQVTTVYEYHPHLAGGEITKVYRQVGNDEQTKALVYEVAKDWSGRNWTKSGSGVVTESKSDQPLTFSNPKGIKETHTKGAGQAMVSEILQFDGLGRLITKFLPGPGSYANWLTYDVYGRLYDEYRPGYYGTGRAWRYDGSTTTLTTFATPDPNRILNKIREFSISGTDIWEIERDEITEIRRKITGVTGDLLSEESNGPTGMFSRFTNVTRARTPGGVVVQTTMRPGVGDPAIVRTYDGLLISTKSHTSDPGTTIEYDELGRAKKVTDFSGRRVSEFTYDPVYSEVSACVTTDTQTNLTSSLENTFYAADTAQRGLLHSKTQNGLITNYAWTERGELHAEWNATYPVKFEYDAAGRRAKMHTYRTAPAGLPNTWPAGDVTEWIYQSGTTRVLQKKDATNAGASFAFDFRGRIAARTWARTVNSQPLTTVYTYNAADEVTKIDYSDFTPDITIVRDARGRVVSLTDVDGQHSYAYKEDGSLESESLPGLGASGTIEYGYDSVGRRRGYSLWKDSNWASWQGWAFDPDTGRYSGIITPEGSATFSYDAEKGLFTGWTIPVGPNGSANVAVTRSFDGFGRVESTNTTGVASPGQNLARSYGYDAHHRRNLLADERGESWHFGYNGKSEVTSGTKKYVDSGGITRTLPGMHRGYSYDAIGNRTMEDVNGVARVWNANALNQYNTREVQDRSYILGQAEPAPSTLSVTAQGHPGGPPSVSIERALPPKEKNFAAVIQEQAGMLANTRFNKVIVQHTVNGAQTETVGHIFLPGSLEAFLYDEDGNLKRDGRWVYTWDAENRLIGMETRTDITVHGPDPLPRLRLTFTYDGFSRRATKKVERKNASGVYEQQSFGRFVYDGWNLIAEWRAEPIDLELIRTYYWGLDWSGTASKAGGVGGLVMIRGEQGAYVPDRTAFIPSYDGNGNIVALVDKATGMRAAEYEYGPFGELLRSAGSANNFNLMRWSTKYTDLETNLSYYGVRYYSSATGRWISREPLGESASKNLLAFVRNRSAGSIDVLGRSALESEDYENVIVRSINSGVTDFNQVWRTLMQTYLDHDPEDDVFWDCQDDVEEMFEAVNDLIHGGKDGIANHGRPWRQTFQDDGSVISHFFGAGSWAGLGDTAQNLFESGGSTSPEISQGDTNRDNAAAYLGTRIADTFDTWSECKCRCIAKMFASGKMKFTDIFGADPAAENEQMQQLKTKKEIDAWVSKRAKAFQDRVDKECASK